MRTKKKNEFSFAVNTDGQIEYLVVYIPSKGSVYQMLIDVEDLSLLDDGPISLGAGGRYAFQDGSNLPSRLFHRRIMNAHSLQVDHVNGNRLDNRRSNLRVVTSRQNNQNRHYHRSGRLPGATFLKSKGKWRARIYVKNTETFLGYFNTQEEAHARYLQELEKLDPTTYSRITT